MRRHEPEVIDLEPKKKPALWKWLLPPILMLGIIAGAVFVLSGKLRGLTQPRLPSTEDVRSDILPEGDSLAVAVEWHLEAASAGGVAESVRVEVGLGDGDVAQFSTVSSQETVDTAIVPAPAPGQTATGYSCVAAVRHGRLGREKCTPWQFVRPTGEVGDSVGKASASAPAAARVKRIVVQPEGVQVDPDTEGRCAQWQREHPGRSVWVETNRTAVPECTGPNGKPTVAQFCA
ncbi:MAG TPA: hypothetical protein VFJ92_03975, partial [Gemmatimonadales bacterium]|nr:hypothetical protein [Gemmatimonadales bacterium]